MKSHSPFFALQPPLFDPAPSPISASQRCLAQAMSCNISFREQSFFSPIATKCRSAHGSKLFACHASDLLRQASCLTFAGGICFLFVRSLFSDLSFCCGRSSWITNAADQRHQSFFLPPGCALLE